MLHWFLSFTLKVELLLNLFWDYFPTLSPMYFWLMQIRLLYYVLSMYIWIPLWMTLTVWWLLGKTKMAYLSENKNKYFGKILSQEVCQLYFLTQERNHLPHTYKGILPSMLVPKCNCWQISSGWQIFMCINLKHH